MVRELLASIAIAAATGCQRQTNIKREPILNASDDTQPGQTIEEFFSRPPLYIQHHTPVKKTIPPFWPPHKFTPTPTHDRFLERITTRETETVNNKEETNSIN
jgi:hypothetical protein